ncbi:transposase [Streptomyces adustus]
MNGAQALPIAADPYRCDLAAAQLGDGEPAGESARAACEQARTRSPPSRRPDGAPYVLVAPSAPPVRKRRTFDVPRASRIPTPRRVVLGDRRIRAAPALGSRRVGIICAAVEAPPRKLRKCRPCPVRTRYATTADSARTLGLPHENSATCKSASTPGSRRHGWKARYTVRSGVEGAINEFVHGHGMLHCRYRGQPKTPLQHVLTAIALNTEHLSDLSPTEETP